MNVTSAKSMNYEPRTMNCEAKNKPKQTQILPLLSSVLCSPSSVHCRFEPKLLNFNLKNNLTAPINSIKYFVSRNEFEWFFYEEFSGKKR